MKNLRCEMFQIPLSLEIHIKFVHKSFFFLFYLRASILSTFETATKAPGVAGSESWIRSVDDSRGHRRLMRYRCDICVFSFFSKNCRCRARRGGRAPAAPTARPRPPRSGGGTRQESQSATRAASTTSYTT